MAKRIRTVPLPLHAGLAAALLAAAVALAFFWVPNDADQGFSQRIFYIHVPIALTAYACFGWGAWKAFVHLWKKTPSADLESYVAIHLGVIFGALTLLTGSIWAKVSWGVWWTWGSDQLVLFLVLFLFYAAYFMLRFSVDPGPARANMSAVYALFGVALIPVSFLAIRLASALYRLELLGKRLDLRLRALRERLEPARSQVRAPVVTPQPLGGPR
jgi:heme exporter protein C